MHKRECKCLLCDANMVLEQESEIKETNILNAVCCECYGSGHYENPKTFGTFMLKLRKEYGWSRKYVAEKLGFNSESSIMNFETGHTIMKPLHVSRFCKITPNRLTVPLLYSMFEAASLKPPCRCVCHHDMNRAVPNIYDEETGACRLCEHDETDCAIQNGHWYEKNENNYYNQGLKIDNEEFEE